MIRRATQSPSGKKILGFLTIRRLVTACLIMTAVIMFIQLVTLTKYPPIFIDESWFSNAAWTWLTTGINFDSMHAGVLDQFGHEWLRRPHLGELPWLVSFKLFGLGFFQARLAAWLLGCGLLVATFFVGTRLYGRSTAAFAVLLLCASPAFIDASHYARQDIWLALVGIVVFGLARYALVRNHWWTHLLVGLIAGASLDVHRNGCIYILGVIALYLVHYGRTIIGRAGAWLCLLGGIAGVMVFVTIHILPNPTVYFKLNDFYFQQGAALPIMGGPVAIARGFVVELLRYDFHQDGLHFVLISISLGLLVWRRNDSDKHLLGFLGGMLLGFALLVANNSSLYRILSFPFFLLAVAEVLLYLVQRDNKWTPERAFIAVLSVLLATYYPLIYLYQVKRSIHYDYDRITEQIIAAIAKEDLPASEETRVMAVPTWWLGLAAYDFRSKHSLPLYMWHNGLSLTESINEVDPDIIVVDEKLRELLYDERSAHVRRNKWHVPEHEFNRYLSEHGRLLTRFSDPEHGRFEVYSVDR